MEKAPPPATRNERMIESMTESRFPEPEPEPEDPYLAPDGRDPRPENGHPRQSSGFRSPFARLSSQPLSANRQHLTWVGRPLPWPPFAAAHPDHRAKLSPVSHPSAHGRDGNHVPTYSPRPIIRFPVSLCSTVFPTAIRKPPTASTYLTNICLRSVPTLPLQP